MRCRCRDRRQSRQRPNLAVLLLCLASVVTQFGFRRYYGIEYRREDEQDLVAVSTAPPANTTSADFVGEGPRMSNKESAPQEMPRARNDTALIANGTAQEEEAVMPSLVAPPRRKYFNVSTLEKSIQPGKHANVPPPDSRIGPDGERGYVHDPHFLRLNPRPFRHDNATVNCAPPGGAGESIDGYRELVKIRRHMNRSRTDPALLELTGKKKNVTLFCSVYTYGGGVRFTNAISETWGRRCDGLLYASDSSNSTTGHVHLPSNSPAGFGYKGMAQRLRTMFAYIYDNFLDEYDYYHFCGDDVYLIVDNLKEFLASERVQRWEAEEGNLLFAGYWLTWGKMAMGGRGSHYLGGGSGYTMSRRALKAYVEGPLQTCNVKVRGAEEDVHVSTCFREHLTGDWIDTRDGAGAHRYHQLGVARHAQFPKKKFGFSTLMIRQSLQYLEREYGFPVVFQGDYISNSSIAFHKHYHPDELRRYEMILYGTGLEQCNHQAGLIRML